MLLTDQDLLDFDHDAIGHFDLCKARDVLQDGYADIYRAQLVTAHWLDGRAGQLDDGGSLGDPAFNEGFAKALRKVSAYPR